MIKIFNRNLIDAQPIDNNGIASGGLSLIRWWDSFLGTFAEDYNQDPTMGKIIGSTLISMGPGVDQCCDLRDVSANTYDIITEHDNSGHWVALGFTLVGMIPTLGSAAKGGLKIMIHNVKRLDPNILKIIAKNNTAKIWEGVGPVVDKEIDFLTKFINDSSVAKWLIQHDIYAYYKYISGILKELQEKINPAQLVAILKACMSDLQKFYNGYKSQFSITVKQQMEVILESSAAIIQIAENKLGEVLGGIKEVIKIMSYQLDIKAKGPLSTITRRNETLDSLLAT